MPAKTAFQTAMGGGGLVFRAQLINPEGPGYLRELTARTLTRAGEQARRGFRRDVREAEG